MDFFNKIGKTVSAGVSGTASKAKELTEVQKINSQIHQQQSDIESKYAQMGKIYYEKFGENGEISELNELCAEINIILAEIEVNKEKINEIKGFKKCESCGELIDNGNIFCPICGVKQSVVVPKCVKCGAVLEEGARFCAKCGTKQPESDLNAAPTPTPAPVPVAEPVTEEPVVETVAEPVVESVAEKHALEEPTAEPVIETAPETETKPQQEDIVPDFVPAAEFDAGDIEPAVIAESEEVVSAQTPETSETAQTPEPVETDETPKQADGKACPNCGSFIPGDSLFCTECGTSLEQKPQNSGYIFCTNCGNRESAGTKFCSECGTKLD